MEMIIGRQGEQKMEITEKTVSRRHCTVKLLDGGKRAYIVNLSPNGTYFDGVKKDSATVDIDATIGLGPYFKAKVSDLIVPKVVPKPVDKPKLATTPENTPEKKISVDLEKAAQYVHYKQVLADHKQLSDLKDYCNAVEKKAGKLPSHTLPIVQTALACKYLRSGKAAAAQRLLYKSGDAVFELLKKERKPELEGAYASMMALLSELYASLFKYDEAEIAGRYAVGIYNRWKPGDPGITSSKVADVYVTYADALSASGKEKQAVQCYEHAVGLYKNSGAADPAFYTAKIVETENKIKGLGKASRKSISSSFPYCATCLYWSGHVEPNSLCTLVYYTPGEMAKCSKTFRGSSNGTPAEQSCNNWEQRFK